MAQLCFLKVKIACEMQKAIVKRNKGGKICEFMVEMELY